MSETLSGQPVGTTAAVEPEGSEPDGVVEIPGKGRMVDVSVVAAERKRARELTEKELREKEIEPLKAQVAETQRLRDALTAAQPYVELVKQHPELLVPKAPSPEEERISDTEATTYASRFELYDRDGHPDIKRAKAIMADSRRDMDRVAEEAARKAVGPIAQTAADQASRQNFVAMAHLRTAEGHPLVDPEILAQEWAQLPSELTQHAQVAETVLNAAIGKMYRAGKRPAPSDREPLFTEPAGGRRGPDPTTLTDLDKRLGLTEKDLKSSQSRYLPGGLSVFGD